MASAPCGCDPQDSRTVLLACVADGDPLYAGPLLYPPQQDRTAEQVGGTVALQMAPVPQILMRGAVSRQFRIRDLLDGERALQLPPMVAVPDAPDASSETGNASWRGDTNAHQALRPPITAGHRRQARFWHSTECTRSPFQRAAR
jgi:hypothetical protein